MPLLTDLGEHVSGLIKTFVSYWSGKQQEIKPEQPAAEPSPEAASGIRSRTIRAVAFSGGGFNTTNQLGFIHALLVAKCQPPQLVTGISAGAINAVALAEVLRAGESTDEKPDRVAQVARFREIFEAVRSFPGEFLGQLLPDPFEVNARSPLKPQALPIHVQEERAERLHTTKARFGFIRLFNDLLRTKVPVSTVTRVVRHILEIRMLAEVPGKRKWLGYAWHYLSLWFILGVNIPRLARVLTRVAIGTTLAPRYEYHWTSQADGAKPLPARFWRWCVTTFWRAMLWVGGLPMPGTAQAVMRRRGTGATLDLLRHGIFGTLLGAGWLIITGTPFGLGGQLLNLIPGGARWWLWVPTAITWLLTVIAIIALYRLYERGDLMRRVLASYDLDKDLATPFAVKPFLVRLFDEQYHGKLDIETIQKSALAGKDRPLTPQSRTPKKLECYAPRGPKPANSPPRIHIFPLVADLQGGKLLPVASSASVVDALLAAGAVVPFFRPQTIKAVGDDGAEKEITAIDGLNISNEPALALFSLLAYLYKKEDTVIKKEGEDPTLHRIECYPVTALPEEPKDLGADGDRVPDRLPLSDAVGRAQDLDRFRDAELGQEMIDAVHQVMPKQKAFYGVKHPGQKESFVYVRAGVFPIRPEDFQDWNKQVLLAESDAEQRRIVAEGIADGCRAALEVLLAKSIRAKPQRPGERFIKCWEIIGPRTKEALPGSGATGSHTPGIPEVCAHCSRFRGAKEAQPGLLATLPSAPEDDWPLWGKALPPMQPPASTAEVPRPERKQEPATRPPAVTMLFSGGVFRGVFQVGVLAALEQTNLKPNVIAGASVGSIMSAMAAQMFITTDPNARQRLMIEVAATFLCIDRLVLTDRFSDFIRRFTVRASETKFSLADIDAVFRRFDSPSAGEFSDRTRRVLAGLERLFYLSPFELKELVRACRNGERKEAEKRLRKALQDFLDRSGVGQEVLGAEPLSLLLKQHVLDKDEQLPKTFARFLPPGHTRGLGRIHLLATATNLTKGRLDVLGLKLAAETDLRKGLLASAAFPGVFRPLWSWEVRPQADCADQLIDGGVMDNLPVTAVIEFLEKIRKEDRDIDRTGFDSVTKEFAPHLMFTASLEPDARSFAEKKVSRAKTYWVESYARSKQLRYNKKISTFAMAQDNLRTIIRDREEGGEILDYGALPLDAAVVCVVPKWLCSTFGFHPMIGFRRAKQAASIAHGCASTFAKLALVRERDRKEKRGWIKAWGLEDAISKVNVDYITKCESPHEDDVDALCPDKAPKTDFEKGRCWLRGNALCPFSEEQLRAHQFQDEHIRELAKIHKACWERKTHESPDDKYAHSTESAGTSR